MLLNYAIKVKDRESIVNSLSLAASYIVHRGGSGLGPPLPSQVGRPARQLRNQIDRTAAVLDEAAD